MSPSMLEEGFDNVLAVIPARYASTRFPGKPMVKILGKPMLQHVYESAKKVLPRVVVATDDQRIVAMVKGFGGNAQMTSKRCQSGTDRMREISRKMRAMYYVNIQGDEPMMHPFTIRSAVRLAIKRKEIATMAMPIKAAQAQSSHVVKVVTDKFGRALYFSRALIPAVAHGVKKSGETLKHLGIYVYPVEKLLAFAAWPSTELEQIEKLEQLRVLYNGSSIYVGITPYDSIGVDTPADLRVVEKKLKERKR